MSFTVHVHNGPEFHAEEPLSGRVLLGMLPGNGDETIIAWRVNNSLRSLEWALEREAHVEFLSTATFEGMEVYRRSLSFLFVLAWERAFGREITLMHSISEGYYWENQGVEVTQHHVDQVKKAMAELVDEDIPFLRKVVSLDEAREIFRRQGQEEVANLFRWSTVDLVELYRCGDTYGYYYAPLAPSTGYLRMYDVHLLQPGMVLQFPTTSYPDSLPPFRASKNISRVFIEYARWLEVLELRTMDGLHERIASGRSQELILVSEAFHNQNLARIAEEIASRPDVQVVAIAGPSGSGKTTFSERLKIQLVVNGLRPLTMAMDNYFLDREHTPRDEEGKYNFEILEALELDLLRDHLRRLLAGEEVVVPQFDFIKGMKFPGKRIQLGERSVLIMEGIHGLNGRIVDVIPRERRYGIFVSPLTGVNLDNHNRTSTTDNRLLRRLIRDARTRGHSAESTLSLWPKVIRGALQYVFPYQKMADTMYNTSLPYELAALRPYAEPVLHTVPEDSPVYGEARRLLSMLSFVPVLPSENIPNNSIIREFIGGSCFDV